jgi:hypothetical protein
MSTTSTIRQHFEATLAGEPITQPIYAVYDWFVRHRDLDWPALFEQGLGIIAHADLVTIERPHVQVIETTTPTPEGIRRDVCWVTDIGELHEWFLGEWRQEHFIKQPNDYRVMARALSEPRIHLNLDAYQGMAEWVGQRGIVLGQMNRTPFQEVQIDMAGLERFSLDWADQCPELLDLLAQMTEYKLAEFRAVVNSPAQYIKLWENLSIETMGPQVFRRQLMPIYRRIFDILANSGKRLLVHYDGNLRVIADDIAQLDFDGIDSFTQAPEGDMTTREARACWPDKFLWLHPNLGWYSLSEDELTARVRQMVQDAGGRRYCLMISEDIPPAAPRTIPAVLRTLQHL